MIAKRLSYFDSRDFQNAVALRNSNPQAVDLSIGIPGEDTAEHIKRAGIRAIEENKTTYTSAAGIIELRRAIAYKLLTRNNIVVNESAISVLPGLTTGLLMVYMALLDPGDEVIVFDPYYPPYPHLASMIGAVPVLTPTTIDFQPDLPELEKRITNKTKLIVINSPNNPTGAVYSESTLRKIVAIAKTHNILLLSDEIYENYIYGGKDHFSVGSIYSNTLTMGGFSKDYAMTGWRLGYIAGPQEVINAINELLQYTVMSSSSIAQYAALEALKYKPRNVQKYQQKRDYTVNALHQLDMPVNGANGAYYLFFKPPFDMKGSEYASLAAKKDVILVPGRAFSSNDDFIRLSYGASLRDLRIAMKQLSQIK